MIIIISKDKGNKRNKSQKNLIRNNYLTNN